MSGAEDSMGQETAILFSLSRTHPSCEYPDDVESKLTLGEATNTILELLNQLSNDIKNAKEVVSSSDLPPTPRQKRTPPVVCGPRLSFDAITEPSRDFLRIPPHGASADVVLEWEIFQQKCPPNALIGVFFNPCYGTNSMTASPAADIFTPLSGLTPPDEERIPAFIDRLLQYMHTNDPVLDADPLPKHG
ncbi:hypothetical protein B0J12DRAFT_790815 [Macrophomina phaseolina]|uniref:Uncharacterized protein n=1 Tax=Macrophomina phaseolina TaxID=35725 RepID=A0ABQ8FQT0_9PEZI|nr:hypothetical protein B0J12DRAFT_790815 [Macrophomina phaseolina]